MGIYAVGLELEGADCLVVGGGEVAARKVAGLREAGARVTVIAPELAPGLKAMAGAGAVRWIDREYRSGDLEGFVLVIAATDSEPVNQQVSQEARERKLPVNVVDRTELCSFIVPAVARQGSLTLAVFTGGKSPMLARRIREELQQQYGPEYEELLALLGELRPRLANCIPQQRRRQAVYEAIVYSDALALIRQGRMPEVRDRAEALIAAAMDEEVLPKATGTVYLIGAGPGDPKLITVRGLECLRSADVVVYDRLGTSELIQEARPGAELVDAGKTAGNHPMPQAEINRLLVERAEAGKVVARLKGGDPFVFGRGGEEAEVLAERGIRFEVVPGVSSAIAAPAYAGIPVTHRGVASSFTVVAGHGAGPVTDWTAPDGTVVFLMGLGNLGPITRRLLEQGRPPETPVAVISSASCPDQKTVTGTLASIEALVAAADVTSPAVIVVGEVVKLRDKLAWFSGN